MEMPQNKSTKKNAVKFSIIVLISLLLLIPLLMVRGVIHDRESTKKNVEREVANSVSKAQTVKGPYISYDLMRKPATDSTNMITDRHELKAAIIDYDVDVETEILKRSIYDVIIYGSTIDISGKFIYTEELERAVDYKVCVDVSDLKGLADNPVISFGGNVYAMEPFENVMFNPNSHLLKKTLCANIKFPEGIAVTDSVDYHMVLSLKGTESLMFEPYSDQTLLTIESSYPHPSFQGGFLPESREVSEDGFSATWKVLGINTSGAYSIDAMGVKFIDPANPYQQATRSAKYGLLVIVLVFVAGLLVEYITGREINQVQYAVIGLSLVLFYSLILSFSEFMIFGVAYLISSLMTVAALMLYFRGILKSNSAYVLGGFTAMVYLVNYILLQMETYALLTGSLILFVLLCVIMYLTSNLDKYKR